MSFIWQTALSVIDLGSSLIYNLLGRDLNDEDIKLIELIFNTISKTKLDLNQIEFNYNDLKHYFDLNKQEIANMSHLLTTNINSSNSKDLLLITSRKNGYNLIQTLIQSILQLSFNILNDNYKLFLDSNESNLELLFDSFINQRIDFLKLLLNKYSCDPNRGILLSNKTKYCINLSSDCTGLTASNSPSRTSIKSNQIRNSNKTCNKYDSSDESRIDETKLETETLTEITNTIETMVKKNNDKIALNEAKVLSSPQINSQMKNPCSYITNVDLSNITCFTDEKFINNLNQTPLDTPLLILCCVYSMHNLLNLSNTTCSKKNKKIAKKQTQAHQTQTQTKNLDSPQPSLHTALIYDLNNSRPSINSITSTIKQPSLIYNNISNSNININNNNNLKTDFKRRHTIQYDQSIEFHSIKPNYLSNQINKISLNKSRTNSIKSFNQNNENSDLYSLWSSSSGSETETESSSSSSFTSTSSLSFNSFNSSIISSYSRSIDSISKLFKTSSKSQHTSDIISKDFSDTESESSEFADDDENDEHENEIDYSNQVLPKEDKLENDLEDGLELSDEDDDFGEGSEKSENNNDSEDESFNEDYTSNIYDYDLDKDEDNYYDKYDYDINSNCCKLNTNFNYTPSNQYNSVQNELQSLFKKKVPSLSTSVHSLPSLSNNKNSNPNTINFKSTTCSTRSIYSSKNSFLYEKLNKQRLRILDLLLKHGADKYLISKLSMNNLRKMSKKSRSILKKWYGVTTLNQHDSEYFSSDESDLDDSYELRPISPIMASLCLDDVDVFSRLHRHNQILFNYFKPDEDYELIYFAIKFHSNKCLVYLLTNINNESLPCLFANKLTHSLSLPIIKPEHQNLNKNNNLNKNVNTMFYILENTRSSKIIKVLLKCGFDLTKREPLTGNTALHCLFNHSITNKSISFGHSSLKNLNRKILSEYQNPKSLSRILFIMLKNGGLKTHVNTLNYERKLCTQILFEWDELIELAFFKTNNSDNLNRNEWKKEFKECLKLLLKAGADLLLNINNNEVEHEGFNNCVETLFNTLLRHSIVNLNRSNLMSKSHQIQFRNRSPSLPAIILQNQNLDQHFFKANSLLKNKAITNNKVLDVEFLYHIMNDIVDLSTLSANLNRAKSFYHYTSSLNSTETAHRLIPRDNTVEKYLEILLNSSIDDFSSAFELFKSLCNFQKSVNNKLKQKFNNNNQTNISNHIMNAQLIKKLISNWILYPNFLNSSLQFEKNNFIKSILIELILNDLYDPNDSNSYCELNTSEIQSNNLLNHCVQLIFLSKTCYQLELIYDLMRTLIQYGANPNLEPYDFGTSLNYLSSMTGNPTSSPNSPTSRAKASNSILAQLCDPVTSGRRSPLLSNVSISRPHHKNHYQSKQRLSFQADQQLEFKSKNYQHQHQHHQHHHHHPHHPHHPHHHSHHQNYFDDYFNELTTPSDYLQASLQSNVNERLIDNIQTVKTPVINKNKDKSPEANLSPNNRRILIPSNPILLLTPSPSFASLLSLGTNINLNASMVKSKNIVIDSSLLFLNHYKRFVKLLYDSMETNKINEVVKSRNICPDLSFCTHKHHYHRYSKLQSNDKLYAVESLDMYLERLTTNPRSLKSLSRRLILNKLITSEKIRKQEYDSSSSSDIGLIPLSTQVSKLPIPKRIKNYLLFIE